MPTTYTVRYTLEVLTIARRLDLKAIDRMIDSLVDIRNNNGRLFFLGVGGGAGNATHAVNDFRKIAGIESYSPSDNVSELTARINDDGWESSYAKWLEGSKINNNDGVFVFSVGGGNLEKNISLNLVYAMKYARQVGCKVLGVVGRDGGYTAQIADACVIIPCANAATITAHTEAFQGIILHLIVSHPKIRRSEMKWESIK
jgi:D-sedoheptulose 7-phosphate isomerase